MNIKEETFINKYKPYYLKDAYIKDELYNIITSLITMDNINLLLVGPSNSGKTTLLYCIIREYYQLSKNTNISSSNIMFINNLKEQGVNFYRTEMKTFCQSQSSIFGKKKIVIIDDMDTLSEQSQQVFRNYIDKYKNNVHFICVCSNLQKILESIQSRLYIFKINNLTLSENSKIMNTIIETEKFNITEDAKEYLLKISDNNIRNIIHNLEKIYIYINQNETIDLTICKKLCSSISIQKFEEYIHYVLKKNIVEAIKILYVFHDYGYSVIDILEFFFFFIKQTTLLNDMQKYDCIPIICNYITVFYKLQENVIELALFTNEICSVINKL